MSDLQDYHAVYNAMQVVAAAVRRDDKYRMVWVQNIAAVAVQAGAGAHLALEKAAHFVDLMFVKTDDEILGKDTPPKPAA